MEEFTSIFLYAVICSNSFANNVPNGTQIIFSYGPTTQWPNPVTYFQNTLGNFFGQWGNIGSWWPPFGAALLGQAINTSNQGSGGCNGTTENPSESTTNASSVRSHPAARHVHKAANKHHVHTKNHHKKDIKSHAHEKQHDKNNHHGN